MSLLAKAIVKNKCWVVEDNGNKIGTILANQTGVVYTHDDEREQFSSLKRLSDRHNIVVEKTTKKKPKESHDIYGYPCDHQAKNILWDVRKKLPVFTKGKKSFLLKRILE